MGDDDVPQNRFEYDAVRETFHAEYADAEPTSLCNQLVSTIAAVSDREPDDVQSLYDSVDPQALETLVRGESHLQFVSFHLCGYPVSVYGDGEIVVDVSDAPDES
ncbi:HalOD1 output domain-containing protein [Haloarchaeobius sp. HRN-SO-5]|uniref:HalOD1 output domain-containing protein n=1 Tax=Haloarchaeobius sp. HRN-SO-5 TaxID=3446118 RepID=UPI003EBC042D